MIYTQLGLQVFLFDDDDDNNNNNHLFAYNYMVSSIPIN